MGKEEDLRRMFQELTGYEKKKIDLKMEGIPASPMQIVQAHQMRDGVTYMRDYILDDEGDIIELDFQGVRTEENQKNEETQIPRKINKMSK